MKLAMILSAALVSDIVRWLPLVVGCCSNHTLKRSGVSGRSIVWQVQCALAEEHVVDFAAARFSGGIHITGAKGAAWDLGRVDLRCVGQVVVEQYAFPRRHFQRDDLKPLCIYALERSITLL